MGTRGRVDHTNAATLVSPFQNHVISLVSFEQDDVPCICSCTRDLLFGLVGDRDLTPFLLEEISQVSQRRSVLLNPRETPQYLFILYWFTQGIQNDVRTVDAAEIFYIGTLLLSIQGRNSL